MLHVCPACNEFRRPWCLIYKYPDIMPFVNWSPRGLRGTDRVMNRGSRIGIPHASNIVKISVSRTWRCGRCESYRVGRLIPGSKQKGRAISDPAFLQFNRFCVSLLPELSADSCQSNQTESKKQQGGGFGDYSDCDVVYLHCVWRTLNPKTIEFR